MITYFRAFTNNSVQFSTITTLDLLAYLLSLPQVIRPFPSAKQTIRDYWHGILYMLGMPFLTTTNNSNALMTDNLHQFTRTLLNYK